VKGVSVVRIYFQGLIVISDGSVVVALIFARRAAVEKSFGSWLEFNRTCEVADGAVKICLSFAYQAATEICSPIIVIEFDCAVEKRVCRFQISGVQFFRSTIEIVQRQPAVLGIYTGSDYERNK